MNNLQPHLELNNEVNIALFPGKVTGVWVDEAIWGHRIRVNSSIGNFQFMEFMSVVESMCRKDTHSLFEPITPEEGLVYKPRRNVLLRNLLFNNAALNRVEATVKDKTNEELWGDWIKQFQNSYEPSGVIPELNYLKTKFEYFEKFANHIRFIQRLTLDAGKSIRWTSKFIFPIGKEAMYTDLGKSMSRERINFMRNGEILYLMLSRSGHSDELKKVFSSILEHTYSKNTLLEKLLPQELIDTPDLSESTKSYDSAYLPYLKHPAYKRLAGDILNLSKLNLPDQDIFQFLVPLFSFHLVLYQLETSRVCNGKFGIGSIVCEIVAPRSDQVRRASLASFNDNHTESVLCVEVLLREFLNNDFFQEIVNDKVITEVDKAQAIVTLLTRSISPSNRFSWKTVEGETFNSTTEAIEEFIDKAKSEHRKKTGEIHRGLGKECGLVSRRGTRSFRYAPTDDFLRMLIITNVTNRVEVGEFLSKMYHRYGIIINHQIAEKCKDIDPSHQSENAFRKNTDRFIRRLGSMGLARQMSDGCTYLENPLYETS